MIYQLSCRVVHHFRYTKTSSFCVCEKNSFRAFFARWAVWFIKKFNIQVEVESDQLLRDRIYVDTEDVLKQIKFQDHELRRIFFDSHDTILVGHDIMATVMRGTLPYELDLPLTMSAKFGVENEAEYKIFNLKIVYCPWIEGWLLLPKIGG